MLITRITTRPYKIALMIIMVCLCDFGVQLITCNVLCKGDLTIFVKYVNTHLWYTKFEYVASAARYMLYYCFILSRIYEHSILLLFITFQHSFRLQNLDIARDKYQKLERMFSKIFFGLCIGFNMPIVISLIVELT